MYIGRFELEVMERLVIVDKYDLNLGFPGVFRFLFLDFLGFYVDFFWI